MSSVAVLSSAELPLLSEPLEAKRARAVGAISGVRTASALEVRPAPAMVPFGIAGLDTLTGGVPRGALTELFGPASSGRTSVMLSLIASATRRQEVCALVDVTDSFDPASGEAAGVDLRRLLWVRCGKSGQCAVDDGQKLATPSPLQNRATLSVKDVTPPAKNISWSIHENYDARLRHAITGGCHEMVRGREVSTFKFPVSIGKQRVCRAVSPVDVERNFATSPASKWTKLDQALKATDLLLQSGGFGMIVIDLGDISIEQARRIPLTSWFRFRRVVENTPTVLLLVARDSCAKTCASLVLRMVASGQCTVNREQRKLRSSSLSTLNCPPSHVNLLDGLDVRVELVRTRLERKPARSTGALVTQTLWKRRG